MNIFHNPIRAAISIISLILVVAIWAYIFTPKSKTVDKNRCQAIVYNEEIKKSADLSLWATAVWQRQQKSLLWMGVWESETCIHTAIVEYDGKEYTIPVGWHITGDNNKILQLIAVEVPVVDPWTTLVKPWSGRTFWKESISK